jgi:hypothetical protein
LKRILIHISGLIQLIVSVLLVIKWLSKPTNAGQLGADNIVLTILLAIVVTLVSFVAYLALEKNSIEKLVPLIIACLTVLTIVIGVPIKEKIEENQKPLMTVSLGGCEMKLFEHNTYEVLIRSAEFRHYIRGTYQRKADKIILDQDVPTAGGSTHVIFTRDTRLYVIEYSSLDTVFFKETIGGE